MSKEFGEVIYHGDSVSEELASKAETHTPKIEASAKVKAGHPFTIKIKVGPHPNRDEHSIRWIELYFYEEGRNFNPIHIAAIHLSPIYSEPEISISIKLSKSGILYALAYCNLHGVWESRVKIEVE